VRSAGRWTLGIAWLGLALASCRDPSLIGARSDVQLTPSPLELPAVYPGQVSQAEVALQNAGTRTLKLRLAPLLPPFFSDALPTEAPPGEVRFIVRFQQDVPGSYSQVLAGEDELGRSLTTTLQVEVKTIPSCPTPVACQEVHFDVNEARCIESAIADGTGCEAHNACLLDAHCQAGRCLGTAVTCDDGNACTLDVCNAVTGCETVPAAPCPGDGKCQLGVCDPQTGCGLKPANDGTVCGSTLTCDAADVCIGGSCVVRDPPDNFVCAAASPCQGEGRCQGSTCVQAAATTLKASWTADATTLPTGGVVPELHDFTVEDTGELSVHGFFARPVFRPNTATPLLGTTTARRCQQWNRRIVCADYPLEEDTGKVSVIDPATGVTVWTYDVTTSRPDFVTATAPGRLFMARMAALGSDRLAALFEGYPAGTPADTQCRVYFLVLLDASGTMLSAARLQDPFLDVCNHPHPFGFTADLSGNLYVAFSGSNIASAPLEAQAPTLLMAFGRDGLFRWKRQEAYAGGEVSVARGLLFVERGDAAHSTANGERRYPVFAGRAVITAQALIPAPTQTPQALRGLDPASGAERWNTAVPFGLTFASDVLRLAEVKARPELPHEPAVLSFVEGSGTRFLWATRARDGASLWMCPLEYASRGPPVLFEVTRNQVSLMDGTTTCGKCDPPFAHSQAEFTVLPLPGVEPSTVSPWPGTLGGPGHEHQERYSGFGAQPGN
jgi:hypothetical protein